MATFLLLCQQFSSTGGGVSRWSVKWQRRDYFPLLSVLLSKVSAVLQHQPTHTLDTHTHHYHFDGLVSEVSVGHRPVLVFGDDASLGQQLQQGAVVFGLRRLGLVGAQQEVVGAAVELRGLQQAADGRFEVLLLILVTVEGLTQLSGDILCGTGGHAASQLGR